MNSATRCWSIPMIPMRWRAAIARAMAMPLAERKTRHAELYAALLRNDISKWGDRFLKALAPPRQGRCGARGPGAARFHRRPTGSAATGPAAPASNTTINPRPSSSAALRAMRWSFAARHQLEAVDRRQAQHDRHQHQLGAQHAQIERRRRAVPPSRIEAALIRPVITSSSTATIAQSENSDRASRMLGSLRRNSSDQHRQPADPEAAGQQMHAVQDGADGGEAGRAGAAAWLVAAGRASASAASSAAGLRPRRKAISSARPSNARQAQQEDLPEQGVGGGLRQDRGRSSASAICRAARASQAQAASSATARAAQRKPRRRSGAMTGSAGAQQGAEAQRRRTAASRRRNRRRAPRDQRSRNDLEAEAAAELVGVMAHRVPGHVIGAGLQARSAAG